MATTTNFGWETPDDTDLVKDGAAAMRTLGNSIDTSFVDLKGGTTGQILSKASNTDLDYSWITNDVGDITAVTAGTGISGGGTSGAVTITNTVATTFDSAGDVLVGTGADAWKRLGIGTAGQVLKVNSGATDLEWAAGSAPQSFSLLGTGTTTSGSTVTVSGISGINSIYILLQGVSSTSAAQPQVNLRINGDTGANYNASGIENIYSSSYFSGDFALRDGSGATSIKLGNYANNAASIMRGGIIIQGCNSSGLKMVTTIIGTDKAGGVAQYQMFTVGSYSGTSTVSSVSLILASGTFDAGDFLVYGSA